MKLVLFAAAVALPLFASPGFAQNMPVATFLEKADALKAQGVTAMFSSDLEALKTEVRTAALAYRQERKAAEASGRKPEVCPPEKGGLDSDELINMFRTIPAEQRRRTTVKQAWISFVKRKYPCPK
jgi:hypothetical protein